MKFRIEQTDDDPEASPTWALTEFFYWDKDVIDIMKRNESILDEAYESIDWELYYERLKDTPFYKWFKEEVVCWILEAPTILKQTSFSHVLWIPPLLKVTILRKIQNLTRYFMIYMLKLPRR